MGPNYPNWVRYLSAAAIIAAGISACVLSFSSYMQQGAEKALDAPDIELAASLQACLEDENCISPNYLVKLASKTQNSDDPDHESALMLLRRAVDVAPYNAQAWTKIAAIEAEQAGGISREAADALRMSIEACWLCDDQDLLRERLTLVLMRWATTPEDIRIAAFEGAELLRWKYEDDDFLAEQDEYAIIKDIPFDTYMTQMAATMKTETDAP